MFTLLAFVVCVILFGVWMALVALNAAIFTSIFALFKDRGRALQAISTLMEIVAA